MSELRELYQEYVLDHGKNPRNFRYPEGATHTADGYNPLCGDKITVQVRLDGDVIADLGFQGQGCAISTASASTMTEAVKGKTLGEARDYYNSSIAGNGASDRGSLPTSSSTSPSASSSSAG